MNAISSDATRNSLDVGRNSCATRPLSRTHVRELLRMQSIAIARHQNGVSHSHAHRRTHRYAFGRIIAANPTLGGKLIINPLMWRCVLLAIHMSLCAFNNPLSGIWSPPKRSPRLGHDFRSARECALKFNYQQKHTWFSVRVA